MSNQALGLGLVTLGCPKNQVDSERFLGRLVRKGFRLSPTVEHSDIVLINTCGFIRDARRESMRMIREFARLKRKRRIRKLIVTGCLAERYSDRIAREIPEVDGFIGAGDVEGLMGSLKRILADERPGPVRGHRMLYGSKEPRIALLSRHSRYLKIAEGCSRRCSFCIIPLLRGRYRSRPMSDVVREAGRLLKEGAREINLIAQDLTAYGRDTRGRFLLAELIKRLDRLGGMGWIRLLYLYPSRITDDLIETIADTSRVCRYLDIPLQHASDRVLERMRRGAGRGPAERLLERLRRRIPGLALRTTFLVGFPGETERDFRELLEFVRSQRFDKLGVFEYSDEEDAPSFRMSGKVPPPLKAERRRRLLELQQGISLEINRALEGRVLDALVDRAGEGGRPAEGRTYRDALGIDGKVFIRSKKKLKPGDCLPVKITRGLIYDLKGEAISAHA